MTPSAQERLFQWSTLASRLAGRYGANHIRLKVPEQFWQDCLEVHPLDPLPWGIRTPHGDVRLEKA
ncbi:hypothetical protein F8S09_13580 [Deinococcus sp. SDU3-2]|uniref:Uncharacterized protein n=1 Tax=Deinococcus terrestris TaxID=2651870 RepID=A0A7X1NXR7_9DEIO|nr:hypothetical protein [Deinococcus terrestris]MPY67700.1 hypothetical protein [Deinococcus terrestris]